MYIGSKKRLATSTGVKILNSEYLLAIHLLGQKLYLIKYNVEKGQYQYIDTITTTYRSVGCIVDLLDFNGKDLIAVSNFDQDSVTLYRLDQNHLSHFKDFPIQKDASHCHGVKFYNEKIVCVTTQKNKMLHFIHIDHNETLFQIQTDYEPKDVCFLDQTNMIVIFTLGNPSRKIRKPYNACIAHYKFNLIEKTSQILSIITEQNSHFDSCINDQDGRIYVTDQYNDCVKVYQINDSLQFVRKISDYSFPHGIDIFSDLLAVTNYGTNQITIRKI